MSLPYVAEENGVPEDEQYGHGMLDRLEMRLISITAWRSRSLSGLVLLQSLPDIFYNTIVENLCFMLKGFVTQAYKTDEVCLHGIR